MKKSHGLDGIPAEFFKVACDTFLSYFEILFNNFYNDSFLARLDEVLEELLYYPRRRRRRRR